LKKIKNSSSTKSKSTGQLRLHIFAGPNGSGKSTVINFVRKQKVKNHLIDFGYYINADDIAEELDRSGINFKQFGIQVKNEEFIAVVLNSGLINAQFSSQQFLSS
jgi:predicted ABC-type ATPase